MSLRLKLANWIAGDSVALIQTPESEGAPRADGRQITLSQLSSWQDLLSGDYGSRRSVSAERAMQHSAVYACNRIISGTIAQLPMRVYHDSKGGVAQEDSTHPLARMLRLQPNPHMSASMFWRSVITSAVLRGNGYAWIERNRAGRVLALWPLLPGRCEPYLVSGVNEIAYAVEVSAGKRVALLSDDVIHIPGSLEWDGLRAKSPLSAAAAAVGIGLDADDFAATHLKNDATPPGVLEYPSKVSPELAELIRGQWQNAGTGASRGKVRVVSEGGVFKPVSLSPEDAQLLETRRFQIEDIARIYGVPPHMIGAVDKTTSWGSGVEQQSIGFVQYTLGMHIKAIEQELELKLFPDSPYFAQVDVRGLLRGDAKTRNDAYKAAIGGSSGPGWMTANEIRRLEDLPPIEDGDKLTQWTQAQGKAAA